jgi:Helix-turn-helix of DDE superfamily endonuclease
MLKSKISDLSNDRQWRATTGFSKEQFSKFLNHFRDGYYREFGKSMAVKIEDSPNKPHVENYEELLYLTLFHLKTGVTYDVLGVIFGMDGSSAKRNFEKGLMVIKNCLEAMQLLPMREFKDVKSFEEHMKGHEKLLIDATEYRVQRPSDNAEQKENYSGKKKPYR